MVGAFTITCNRLPVTAKYIDQLSKKAGMPFEHIIIDNGSTDGTVAFLRARGYKVLSLGKNYGILPAMKIAVKYFLENSEIRYIVKFDDDCEIHTPDILKKIVNFFEKGCKSCVLAPLDDQILETQQPKVFHEGLERGQKVRYTRHVGGIFKAMPRRAAELLLKTEDIKINGDLKRGDFWRSKGLDIIYLTDLIISHRGQGKQTKNYNLG